MVRPKGLARRLAVIGLLMLMALWRAERGVAELQGGSSGASRLFHLSPGADGRWHYSLLGHEGALDPRLVLVDGRSPLLGGRFPEDTR